MQGATKGYQFALGWALEVRRNGYDPRGALGGRCGAECDHSDAEPDLFVRPVHRTVRDFLTQTAEGLAILRHDQTPRSDYQFRILVSTIARCREFGSATSHYHFPQSYANALDMLCILHHPTIGIDPSRRRVIQEALEVLYDQFQLRWNHFPTRKYVPPPSSHRTWQCKPRISASSRLSRTAMSNQVQWTAGLGSTYLFDRQPLEKPNLYRLSSGEPHVYIFLRRRGKP